MKDEYIRDGLYKPQHCYMSAIKLYKDQIFVTVPRIRYYTGVPSVLNKVIIDPDDGMSKLEPFPNWEVQRQGNNCDNLQMAMSMEIDPIMGYLYVIDPGRPGLVGTPEPGLSSPYRCPPKVVIFDINEGTRVRTIELPASMASKDTNYLNDIVLDRGDPNSTSVRWVYVTDSLDAKLYVIDLSTNETRALQDSSMNYDEEDTDININGKDYTLKLPINGLALSRDFKYVYYCAVGSLKLWRVPTFVLRDPKYNISDHVVFVGKKVSQTGGMMYATDSLYYGGLAKNAVYKWDVKKDKAAQKVDEGQVKIKSELQLVRDDVKTIFPDAFAVSDDGYLYFTACRANLFLRGGMDFSGNSGSNFRIWKVKIGELGYLSPSTAKSGEMTGQGSINLILLLLFVLPSFVM